MIFRKGEMVRVISAELLDDSVKQYANKLGIVRNVFSLESPAPFVVAVMLGTSIFTASFDSKELELVAGYDTDQEIKSLRDAIKLLKV